MFLYFVIISPFVFNDNPGTLTDCSPFTSQESRYATGDLGKTAVTGVEAKDISVPRLPIY